MSTQHQIHIKLPSSRANTIPNRKLQYAAKLKALLSEYNTCLIISIINVGSKQINELRKDFRGRARFIFGKNTLMRKVIRDYVKETGNTKYIALIDAIEGHCGFVFTHESIAMMRKELISRKTQRAAKVGVIAPNDVYMPSGPTGLEPTKGSGFSVLNIPTRIYRGQIQIEEEILIIKKGENVGATEAAMLNKLGIKPFYYGVRVEKLYDNGMVFEPHCTCGCLQSHRIAESFYNGLMNVSALCFEINYPVMINVPHSLLRGYKSILALGLELERYSWNGLDDIKEMLDGEVFLER